MSDYSQETAIQVTPAKGAHQRWTTNGSCLTIQYPASAELPSNRANKRNSLIHPLRGAILGALRDADDDDDIKVSIVRGDGPSFSAGYDLAGGNTDYELPFFTAQGEGQWPRHVTEGWMSIWDLANRSSHRFTDTAWQAVANSPLAVISSTWPKMPKWVTRPPGSVSPTCTFMPGSWGCARRWK